MEYSKRKYHVIGADHNGTYTDELTIQEILTENAETDCEIHYAMRDITDEILDLKKNESMYFQPNRDDDKTKGIILRVR